MYSHNRIYASQGCVLQTSSDRDDQRNFSKFSFPGFLGGLKIYKYLFGWLDLSRDFYMGDSKQSEDLC